MNRRLGFRSARGRAGADSGGTRSFSPLDLSPLAWYRADPIAITLNGSDVSAWADQSGNGHHLLQATPANQPLYTAADANFNNQPSLTFTAANSDVMQCLTGGLNGNQVHSVFAVIRTGALAGAFAGYVYMGRSSGVNGSSGIGQSNGNNAWYAGGSELTPQGAVLAPNTKYQFGKTHNGTNSQGYRNGVADGAAAARTYALASPSGFLIGGRDAASGFGNFSIPEWVVYGFEASAQQISDLTTYFTGRYGA